jgi:hypothetical protein
MIGTSALAAAKIRVIGEVGDVGHVVRCCHQEASVLYTAVAEYEMGRREDKAPLSKERAQAESDTTRQRSKPSNRKKQIPNDIP